MSFVENLYQDEIRDGFLVTTDRKKLWNAQIGLILEVDRICKKHNIKYFAYGGTLLGAVRHKGFIPWDDDVDLAMLRPDYEKFKQVALSEIKEPYYLDLWYNHNKIPGRARPIFFPFLKIRDNRTTMIELPQLKNINQGIWIDVFPIDNAPPFQTREDLTHFKARTELLNILINPEAIRRAMNQNNQFVIAKNSLEKLLSMSFHEQALQFEKFIASKFMTTEFVIGAELFVFLDFKKKCKLKWFDKIIEIPFEKATIPVPTDSDQILTALFGNWHEKIRGSSKHSVYQISPDIPYKDFFDMIID